MSTKSGKQLNAKAKMIGLRLPKEVCEERVWAEFLEVKTSHPPDEFNRYVSPKIIYDAILLAHKRRDGIEKEIHNDWDYMRVRPEVGMIEEPGGYGWNLPRAAPLEKNIENEYWIKLRIYARAFRIKPMKEAHALIARGLIEKYLDNNEFDLVSEFNRRVNESSG